MKFGFGTLVLLSLFTLGATISHAEEFRQATANKFNPFYCNWLVDPTSKQIFSYHSSRLSGIDLETLIQVCAGSIRIRATGVGYHGSFIAT